MKVGVVSCQLKDLMQSIACRVGEWVGIFSSEIRPKVAVLLSVSKRVVGVIFYIKCVIIYLKIHQPTHPFTAIHSLLSCASLIPRSLFSPPT